jgi:hypothetical protein
MPPSERFSLTDEGKLGSRAYNLLEGHGLLPPGGTRGTAVLVSDNEPFGSRRKRSLGPWLWRRGRLREATIFSLEVPLDQSGRVLPSSRPTGRGHHWSMAARVGNPEFGSNRLPATQSTGVALEQWRTVRHPRSLGVEYRATSLLASGVAHESGTRDRQFGDRDRTN